MALVLQQIFPDVVYTPYERPPQTISMWTAIPRGMHSLVASVALTAKPVNDTYLMTIVATLPPNFAYVMESLYFGIVVDQAEDFRNRVNLNIQNFFRGGPAGLTANYTSGFVSTSPDNETRSISRNGGDGSSNGAGNTPWPTFPLTGGNTAGVQINFSAWNNTATVAAAGTIDFYLNFWQFDLEQLRKYPVNSPLPVQMR